MKYFSLWCGEGCRSTPIATVVMHLQLHLFGLHPPHSHRVVEVGKGL